MELMKKTHTILCKTKQCYNFFKNKHDNVIYTKFKSICSPSRAIKDNNLYLHLGGDSYMKGSDSLLKCWVKNKGYIDINPNIKLFITLKKFLQNYIKIKIKN